MPTREELEIMLRDSITPGLRSIARELRALNQTAKESGSESAGNIEKFGKSFGGVEASSNQALRSMTAMGSYVIGFGKSVMGIGGTVESIKKLSEGINEFAESRQQLTMFSQDTKFAAGDISQMRQAMKMMGIETKQADAYMAGFSGKLKELQTFHQGSQLFQDLEKMGGKGVELGNKLIADVDAEDYKKAVNDVFDFYEKQTPRAQAYLQQMFGIPAAVFDNLREYQKLTEETFEGDEAKAKQFMVNKTIFFARMDSEWKRFADHALISINKVTTKLEEDTKDKHFLSDAAIEGWDKFSKMIAQDKSDIDGIISLMNSVSGFFKSGDDAKKDDKSWGEKTHDWMQEHMPWASDQAIREKIFGKKDREAKPGEKEGATFEERFGAMDELKTQKENTKLLESIRDTLDKATGGSGGVSGSQAAEYGMGIRRPGGAMQAGGGGFRPRSGVRGAKDPSYSYAGGETPDLSNLKGGEYLRAQRSPMYKELEEHPELKERLAALTSKEDKDYPTQVVESLMNRTAYVNEERKKKGLPPLSLRDMIRPDSPVSFYGPERRHEVEAAIERLRSHPAEMKKYMDAIDNARESNTLKGYTDQGTIGDPNYIKGGPGITMPNSERFNDWGGGPGEQAGARSWRERQQRAVLEGARDRVDKSQSSNVTAPKGSANVSVDFGTKPDGTATDAASRALAGGPFKDLKINREPQSSKAGDPADNNSNSRWYFQ